MTNEEYITKCRFLIEKKIGRGSYLNWTNGDYEKLSEQITEELKEYISTSSLKRIFGKVNYASAPSISTLNILVRFVGYKDWYEFVNVQKVSGDPLPLPETDTVVKGEKRRFNTIALTAGITVILVLLAGLAWWFTQKESQEHNYSISYKMSKTTSPSNVVFEYDISNIKSNEVYLDFNDHFAKRDIRKKLDKNQHTITHTYMISSVYRPLLSIDGKVVDTLNVPVYSDGWEFVIAKYLPASKEFFPVAVPSISKKNGILTIPASEVYKYIEDTVRDYWIKYRYIKNFDVPPDHLSFKIKGRSRSYFKNHCNEIDVWLICANNNIVFKIFDPGCGGEYSKVQLGNKILDGNYNDLSAFGHDLSEWQEIALRVDNKKATISIGNKIIYEGTIEGEIGTLSGFIIHSKGPSEFDYVDLEAGGKTLFRDDF